MRSSNIISSILRQDDGTNVIDFMYDENGSAVGFVHNGNKYIYTKNVQGDITGIIDYNSMVVIAQYRYDAWGKLLSVTDVTGTDVSGNASHIANVNPLRYRGYYYDVETGLYYLKSRYYDPETCRFVNGDSKIAGLGGDLCGYNLYAYCFNNPVNAADNNGNWPQWLKDAANWVNNNIIQPVANFFSNNFGAQTTTTVVDYEYTDSIDFILFKVSKTDSISYEIEKGESKSVTAYADTTNKNVGIKTEIGNGSGKVEIGLDGLSEEAGLKINEQTYTIGYNDKIITKEYSFSITDDNNNFTTSYSFEINKLTVIAVVFAPQLAPTFLGGGSLIELFA